MRILPQTTGGGKRERKQRRRRTLSATARRRCMRPGPPSSPADRQRSVPSCVLLKRVPQGRTESGGIVLAANAGPRVPSGDVTQKRRCTYRPSVIYLIVNKLFSLSLSLSLSAVRLLTATNKPTNLQECTAVFLLSTFNSSLVSIYPCSNRFPCSY